MAAATVILLVTDIPDHTSVYGAALRARGYRVVHAHSGAAALSLAALSAPACVVIDVRLPDMTGWELCRRLKQEDELKHMPVVVLAQDVSDGSAQASRDAGCTSWLARPMVGEDLVRTIEYVLSLAVSEPASREEAVLGVRACPACGSEQLRAGVRVGPVQYYGCVGCGMRWRVEAQGEATA